jgi:hypothetical protein
MTDLLPAEVAATLPALYSQDGQGYQAIARAKWFAPGTGWTWYATEYDGADLFFGLVIGLEAELGYFTLSELQAARGPLGLPIERDLHFRPATLAELRDQHGR